MYVSYCFWAPNLRPFSIMMYKTITFYVPWIYFDSKIYLFWIAQVVNSTGKLGKVNCKERKNETRKDRVEISTRTRSVSQSNYRLSHPQPRQHTVTCSGIREKTGAMTGGGVRDQSVVLDYESSDSPLWRSGSLPRQVLKAFAQIGRASCRERV